MQSSGVPFTQIPSGYICDSLEKSTSVSNQLPVVPA